MLPSCACRGKCPIVNIATRTIRTEPMNDIMYLSKPGLIMPAKLKSKRNRFAFVERVPPAEVAYATEKEGAARLMSILYANLKEAVGKEATRQESIVAHWRREVRIGLGKCCSRVFAMPA